MSPSPLQLLYDAIGADFLQTLSDGIAMIDLDTQRPIFVNRALAEMHGYSLESFIREPLSAIVHPDHYHTLTEILNTLQPDQCIEWDAVSLRQDGSSMPIEATVSHYQMNETPYAVFQVRNSFRSALAYEQADRAHIKQATELEQALDALQKTQSQLIQSEKMSSLGQLVAGIAHEINNPVNFIHGNVIHTHHYTQDLLELVAQYQTAYPTPPDTIAQYMEDIDLKFLQADLPKMLQSMQTGTERIREIVKSLRLFSRLDEAELKCVNLHEGLDSTLLILQSRIQETLIRGRIVIQKNYGEILWVECLAGQLNQVFMNIIVNAIDALEERDHYRSLEEQKVSPSCITITTSLGIDRQTCISIHDNGPGIPDAIQPLIFDPFFTTKEVGKGTGLGMSISYQIITEKHGGTLTLQSTPETGTTFTIMIPSHSSAE